jgi:hypothetical protein
MSSVVTGTALLKCSFGSAPSSLTVLPVKRPLVLAPVGTILDSKPIANLTPFGTCSSLANPLVAAATAAALGVLTPMPCVPVTPLPWLPLKPTVLVGGCPVLTSGSMTACLYGGLIQISLPGQMKVQT